MPPNDPITLEVISQELVSIPNQIDKNITRTAFSAFISEYKDYSVGIVDASGALISQSRGSLAIFVANALGTAVRDGLQIYGADRLRAGDVVISNHAGTLGQHLNNVVMYTPIRGEDGGELIAFFCVLGWVGVSIMPILSGDSLVSLPWVPMNFVQSVIPVSSALIVIAELTHLVDLVVARGPPAAAAGGATLADGLH